MADPEAAAGQQMRPAENGMLLLAGKGHPVACWKGKSCCLLEREILFLAGSRMTISGQSSAVDERRTYNCKP